MSKALCCLVIGANGFVGSNLVDELAEAGFYVRAFDRFSRPAQFIQRNNIEVCKGDFFDDITVTKILDGVDYMFHSFSATTPFTADTDPYTDVNLNLLRNIYLFEKAVETNIKKVVYISSGGAVYGNIAERQRVSEEDAPAPVSPYGIGKLASEYYLAYFNRKYGLEYVAYRLSNPYGPRQITKNNQGVIPTFIEKISNQEEVTIIGDGESSRDYIYIRDATAMIVQSFIKAKHPVYNLGSGKQTSVNEILSTLKTLLNAQVELRHIEEPKTFLRHSQISVERFEEEFNIQKLTDLHLGLSLTLAGR